MEKPLCPQCKSSNVIPILYGTPSEEDLEAEKWEELEISDADYVDGVSPTWKCLTCGFRWHAR